MQMQTEALPLALLTSIRELHRLRSCVAANESADRNVFSGADGSRSIKTVQVDTSGNGTHFVPAEILINGDPVHGFRRTRLPLYTDVV